MIKRERAFESSRYCAFKVKTELSSRHFVAFCSDSTNENFIF